MAKAMLMVMDVDGTPQEIVEVTKCDARDHEPRLAIYRVYWPTGPGDYCEQCAARLLEIGRVMGVYVHVDALPQPILPARRAVSLTGVPS